MPDPAAAPPRVPGRYDALLLWLAPLAFLVFWSAGYTGVKIGVADVEPITLLALRYIGVVVLLVPAMAILRPPLPRDPIAWLHMIVVGVLVQACYFGGTNLAISLGVSAVGMTIVLALQPILVALIAPRIVGERVDARVWAGLMLGIAGALVAVAAKGGTAGGTIAGIVTTCFALVFITAGTIYEKRFGAPHHPVVSNLVQSSAALAISLPAAMLLESGRINVTMSLVASLSYLVIFNSVIAMMLLFAMIRRGAASRVSALFFLVPPTSSLIAWVVLGEAITVLTWLGMALAGAGVLVVGSPFRTRGR